MSITTKTGDRGKTSLANGERKLKSSLVFEAIGDFDELNSWIGVVVASLSANERYQSHTDFLKEIQQMIYVISAELVRAKTNDKEVVLKDDALTLVEKWCANLEKQLGKNVHQRFLYPGGCKTAAWVDVARSVCRRAERSLVRLSTKNEVRPIVLSICNRLSDYLYLLRCFINQEESVEEKQLSLDEN